MIIRNDIFHTSIFVNNLKNINVKSHSSFLWTVRLFNVVSSIFIIRAVLILTRVLRSYFLKMFAQAYSWKHPHEELVRLFRKVIVIIPYVRWTYCLCKNRLWKIEIITRNYVLKLYVSSNLEKTFWRCCLARSTKRFNAGDFPSYLCPETSSKLDRFFSHSINDELSLQLFCSIKQTNATCG